MCGQDKLRQAAHRLGLQIAIDGPAGAGKSTVGHGLARALGCPYLDTGLMYRAVTREALRRNIPITSGAKLARLAGELRFDLPPKAEGQLIVNGSPAGEDLRSSEVDAAVSAVSAHPQVRNVLVERQRELAARGCIVMVGRDIGTVVLPHAAFKLFVTASADVRARRRGLETHQDLNRVSSELLVRDRLDSNRAFSPLRRAEDAAELVTDELTESGSIERSLALLASRLPRTQARE